MDRTVDVAHGCKMQDRMRTNALAALCGRVVTEGTPIKNLDKLTYARNLEEVSDDPRYLFVHSGIADCSGSEAFGRCRWSSRDLIVIQATQEARVDPGVE